MIVTRDPHLQSIIRSSTAKYSTKLGPMQKIIMLCGAPGVGKGTYARLLADDFGYEKVSTGDEIRKIVSGRKYSPQVSPQLRSKLQKCVASGKLVTDEIIMEILYHKINEPSAARGIILDGFPRNIGQFNMFTQVLPIHLVINLEQSTEYLMASLLGRRTCLDCGTSYSAYSFYKDGYELDVQMPEVEGVCDNCSGPVVTRDDDKEEVVKARLEEYEMKTFPLLKRMQEKGMVINFEGKRGIRDYPKLQQLIISRVGLPYYYFNYNSPDHLLTPCQD